MKYKQIILLCSVVVFSSMLAACGGSSSDSSSTESTNSNATNTNSNSSGSSTNTGSNSTTTNSSGSTDSGSNTNSSNSSGSTNSGSSGSTSGSSGSTSSNNTDNSGDSSGSGNSTGTETADNCFNIMLYSTGTKVEMTHKTTSPEGQLTATSVNTVKGIASFNGKSVIEILSNVTATGVSPSKSTQNNYFTVDNANLIEYYHGSIINVTEPAMAAGKQTLTLTPAMEDRFALSKGQSSTQSYQTRTEGSVMGFPYSTTTDQTKTKKFAGMETVTVPAGTFKSCRFEETVQATTLGKTTTDISTHWVAFGSGLEIKTVAGTSTTELLAANINGSAVTGN